MQDRSLSRVDPSGAPACHRPPLSSNAVTRGSSKLADGFALAHSISETLGARFYLHPFLFLETLSKAAASLPHVLTIKPCVHLPTVCQVCRRLRSPHICLAAQSKRCVLLSPPVLMHSPCEILQVPLDGSLFPFRQMVLPREYTTPVLRTATVLQIRNRLSHGS